MQQRVLWWVIPILLAFFLACETDPQPPASGNSLIRETEFGPIEGVEDDFDTLSWRSVPFAAPPVGDLRWREPQDPAPWEEVLETKEFSDICTQYVAGSDNKTTILGSEDCLYLNIWEPKKETSNPLPVYVWIHGGGNSIQMPFNSDLKGAKLAQLSDLVVVSFNYRLGPMGWFSHSALKEGDAEDDSGNYGTMDIIKVLQWVQDNISEFGGDPNNVTIAGESAGGMNVMSMLISQKAKGLFHKGISESGGPMASTMEAAEEHANMLLSKLLVKDGIIRYESGVSDYLKNTSADEVSEYLRSKKAEDFLKCYDAGQGGMISTPNILTDGTIIPADGYAGFTSGTYANKVPLIVGANTYEAKLFLYSSPAFESVMSGEASPYLTEKYGEVTQEVLDSQSELYGLVSKYASDVMIASGVDGVARKLARASNQPSVYAYQFNWGAADAPGEGVIPEPLGYAVGACHGMEIDFFFGLADEKDLLWSSMLAKAYTDENRGGRVALGNAITDYISAFVRTGNPNPANSNLLEWSPWQNGLQKTPKKIIFDADFDAQTIEMSTEAITMMSVTRQLQAEPRYEDIQEFMGSFLEAFGG